MGGWRWDVVVDVGQGREIEERAQAVKINRYSRMTMPVPPPFAAHDMADHELLPDGPTQLDEISPPNRAK